MLVVIIKEEEIMNKRIMNETFTKVDSSTIAGIAKENEDLLVEFNSGATYLYKNAGKLLEDFKNSESKGRYFAGQIKNKFEYSRL